MTHGTFDLFDRHCDGQKGLHTHFLPINVTFVTVTVTESLRVNGP